ncbi:cytochrome P450 [Trichoderma novae-zelandiae]
MDNNSVPYASRAAGLPQDDQSTFLRLAVLFVLVPAATFVLWHVVAYLTSPLRKYPGPLLAAYTNFYRMYYAYRGNMHLISKKLHDKYGPVVRMGPNYLDVDYSSLIKTCFDTQGVWRKTEWHGVSGAMVEGKLYFNIFSEVRPEEHARIKKPVARYFSAAGVAPLEPHVDAVLATLCGVMDQRFAGDETFGSSFDFSEWMLFYAMDVVAKTTWSQAVGYLEKGHDFDGTLSVSDKAYDYLVTIGMNPVLDKFLDKNPIMRIGPPAFGAVTGICLEHLMARMKGEHGHDQSKPDFLDRYLEAQQQNPEVVDVYRILSYMLVNVAAGADTTAASLRSIFYLSLKHRVVYDRLRSEILATEFSQLPVPYAESRQLPYLEAVSRECFRYLPGNCFAQERYVPDGGLSLPDGSFVPAGTAIGFNAYVLHRNKEVWGADAEEFRPERWLQADGETADDYKNRLQHLNNMDLSFSAGSRKCIGMNLGKMEVSKTVATLITLFDFELADPKKEWTIHNSLIPRASDIIINVKRRSGTREQISQMSSHY